MFEWTETGDPESTTSRSVAAKTRYRLPRHVFGRYKSAEVHTKSRTRMPMYVYVFVLCVLGVSYGGWRVYQSFSSKVAPISSPVAPAAVGVVAPGASSAAPVVSYVDSLKPRVAAFAHTAPRYDEITKPVDAPWPTGCVLVGSWRGASEKCRCVDQQGNTYATSDSMCRHIVQNGLFKDWGQRDAPAGAAQPQRAADRSGVE